MKRPSIYNYATLHKYWMNDILYCTSLRDYGIVRYYYWQPDYESWVYQLKMSDGTKRYEFEKNLEFIEHFS